MSTAASAFAPRYASWLRSTNNITQQFLAIGGRQDFVSLAGGLPAAELYPVEAVRDAMDRALNRWKTHALGIWSGRGISGLAPGDRPPHVADDRAVLWRREHPDHHGSDAGP
jgi:hypothetical protein